MKTLLLLLLAPVLLSVGCAHTANFTSEPKGVDVYIEGKKVGTTPFAYEEKSAGQGPVAIVAKQGGREKKINVPRSQIAVMPIAAGAGAGAAACVTLNAVSCLASFVIGPFAWPIGIVGCLALPGGAGVGWYLYGSQMPDVVTIDMKDAEVPPPPEGEEPPEATSTAY